MQRHPHDELLVGVDDFDVAAGYQVPAVAQVFQAYIKKAADGAFDFVKTQSVEG